MPRRIPLFLTLALLGAGALTPVASAGSSLDQVGLAGVAS